MRKTKKEKKAYDAHTKRVRQVFQYMSKTGEGIELVADYFKVHFGGGVIRITPYIQHPADRQPTGKVAEPQF
jgi:hypothetical protein